MALLFKDAEWRNSVAELRNGLHAATQSVETSVQPNELPSRESAFFLLDN